MLIWQIGYVTRGQIGWGVRSGVQFVFTEVNIKQHKVRSYVLGNFSFYFSLWTVICKFCKLLFWTTFLQSYYQKTFFCKLLLRQLFANSGPRTQALIAEEDLYSNCSHSSYTSVWSLFNRLCLVFQCSVFAKGNLMIFLINIDNKNDVLTQQNWAKMWNYDFQMIDGLATIGLRVPKTKKIFFWFRLFLDSTLIHRILRP